MLHFTGWFIRNLPPFDGFPQHFPLEGGEVNESPHFQRVEKKEQLQGCLPFGILYLAF